MIRAMQVGNPLRGGILTPFMAFVSAAVAGAADTPAAGAESDLARQILKAAEGNGADSGRVGRFDRGRSLGQGSALMLLPSRDGA